MDDAQVVAIIAAIIQQSPSYANRDGDMPSDEVCVTWARDMLAEARSQVTAAPEGGKEEQDG